MGRKNYTTWRSLGTGEIWIYHLSGGKGAPVIEDQALLQRLYESQAAIGRGMGNLFAVVEAYPDLRSSDQILELQAQLEGTENRIAVARKDFNASVKAYNGRVRRFPGSLWAGMFGFDQRDYFESVAGSEAAPTVDFGS